jgi:general secretion pathway protein B
LPEDVKRNLPPLAVGGSMYSPEAAKRMLILNGQLVREGEKVAPDVVLESIRLRSAILRYKEQRFEITY